MGGLRARQRPQADGQRRRGAGSLPAARRRDRVHPLTGVPFLGLTLLGFAVAGGAAGILLLLAPAGAASPRSAAFWRDIGETPWRGIPGCAVARLAKILDGAVTLGFGGSPRDQLSGGVFVLVVFAGIPLAAAINALRGGSPFLIAVILAASAGSLAMLLAGEGRGRLVAAVLAPVLFAVLALFVPAYAWVSLTHRLLQLSVVQAAAGSVLLLPLLYVVAQSTAVGEASLFGRPGDVAVRPAARLAASVTLAFPLTFAAVLYGHLGLADESIPTDWRYLLASLGVNGVAWAAALAALARWRTAGLAAAVVVGIAGGMLLYAIGEDGGGLGGPKAALDVQIGLAPDGGGIMLGPRFWLCHLPYAPAAAAIAAMLAGLVAKLAHAATGDLAMTRPRALTGLALLLASACAGGLGALILVE